MGGASSEVSDSDPRRHRRVGDLRSREHSADRVPVRAAVGGEPALREGPGVPARPPRGGPRDAADPRMGGRHGRRSVAWTRSPHEPEPRRVAFRPARVDRLLGTELGEDAQREVLRRVGIETEEPSGAIEVAIAGGDLAGRRHRARGNGDSRHRADVAPRHRGRGGHRGGSRARPRLRARAAATARRPSMPGWRETPLARARRDPRRARGRRAHRGGHVCARLAAPARGVRVDVRGPAGGGRGAHARARRSPSPTRCRWTTRSCASRSSGSLVEVVDSNARHGQADVAAVRGRQGLRAGGGRLARVVAARARAHRRVRGSRPGTGPRRDADLDDAKGADRARRSGLIGASAPAYPPLTDRAAPASRPERDRRIAAAAGDALAIAGVVGELHPAARRGVGPARAAGRRRRAVRRGARRRAALPVVELRAAAARFQPIERDLTVDVAGRCPGSRRGGAAFATQGGPLLERRHARRNVSRASAGPGRAQPHLPAAIRGRRIVRSRDAEVEARSTRSPARWRTTLGARIRS